MKTETGTLILLLIILAVIVGYFIVGHIQQLLTKNTTRIDEAFVNARATDTPVLDSPEDFYDDYYVQRIDQSYYPESKNICRCAELYKSAYLGDFDKDKTKSLLIGANTGRFLDALVGISPDTTGLVLHESLLEKARENAPKAKVVKMDYNKIDPKAFMENTFTHIVLEDRTYYQIPTPNQRKQLLSVAFKWLVPGGKLIIRCVEPLKFDPMIPTAVPLRGINIQNYLEKRKHNSASYFDDGSYITTQYTPIPSEHRSVFREDLYYPNGTLKRTQIHRLNMPTRDMILEEVLSLSYSHEESIPLKPCTSPGEYYEIFIKPEYKEHMKINK
jgi:hypothetical protein